MLLNDILCACHDITSDRMAGDSSEIAEENHRVKRQTHSMREMSDWNFAVST